ncbi:hypothetical protein GON09_005478 [Rhodococcus sp. B50]|nr:hypothetical protein [Rhodococcus sp. B50]
MLQSARSILGAFGDKIRAAGLMPSFGTVGDGLDNVMMELFGSSMQTELLNRKKWKTRLELANAIFDYIEIFYIRQRRHSSLDYRARSNTNYYPSRIPFARDLSPDMETETLVRSRTDRPPRS